MSAWGLLFSNLVNSEETFVICVKIVYFGESISVFIHSLIIKCLQNKLQEYSSAFLLLARVPGQEVGPVEEAEREEGGRETHSGENVYLLGSKLVVLDPGFNFRCWRIGWNN